MTIRIYNIAGELVGTLAKDNNSTYGKIWDGTNDTGEKVASGVYVYFVTNSAGEKATGKIMVIR